MTSLWLDRPDVGGSPSTPSGSGQSLPPSAQVVVVGAGVTGLVTALLGQRAGLEVVVLEARHLGAATTGNTTAKISLLQGSVLSQIRAHHDDDAVAAYVEANLDGQRALVDLMDELGVAYQRETAYSFAHTDSGMATLRKEFDAAVVGSLGVRWAADVELPFEVAGAVALDGQVQVDPVELLVALREAVVGAGGAVLEGVRVTGVGVAGDTVHTSAGDLTAEHVVLATGAPILDRGAHFVRLVAKRSYALAFEVPDESTVPAGMYLAVDEPSRSVRYAPRGDGSRLLLVGGNGHEVGREQDTATRVEQLVAWTTEHWPGARLTHQWSAQDYQAENHLPVVQRLPGAMDIHVATGFNKWGMTNGPAAALALVAVLAEAPEPTWRHTLRRRIPGLRDVAEAAVAGNKVGYHMARGWAGGVTSADRVPAPGEGTVGRRGGRLVATSNVDGRVCSVSAVCTHLGGVLQWNAAETSWDCPLHGSRFAADGTLLEGMATKDLARLDPPE